MAGTETPNSTWKVPVSAVDPIKHLPLPLLRSDPIPPSPTRSLPPGSTIDWHPNFSDLSWVAYGASSLLVISHFPSPLSSNETAIGPHFRQVFELSSFVNAVSWSPATPSIGELAAAADNSVWVFSHDSATSKGSFCWSQNAVIVQSTKVEAIRWTDSGDGIIAGGLEVVLWKKANRSWEIAWKYQTDRPQTLVSATWSIEGPSATAAYPNKLQTEGLLTNEASRCVSVCQSDGKLGYSKVELHHPLPVLMIQWRGSRGRQSNGDAKHSRRHVLLTCCLDGTVRLWTEIDSGRVRKIGKDVNDYKTTRRSFCVAAVIEINQALRGTLGLDVYVTWATEIGGMHETGEGAKKFFSSKDYEHDKTGSCEWIIGFGPGVHVSLWAIHCLDDVSPMRFPRVTLWKTEELQGLEVGHLHRSDFTNSQENRFLPKVAILRSGLTSPPIMCSFIQLLPCNSLVWSLLSIQTSSDTGDIPLNKSKTENTLSCLPGGLLNLDGHAGNILQVAVHPYSCEVQLAVSLDSNGLLLFWSLSTISNCILGHPTLIPTWELYGKLVTRNSCSKYTSLRWAPSVLDSELVLLMGHIGGIDCFIGFQALSWEVTLHSYSSLESCCDDFEVKDASESSVWGFESTFSGKKYCINVNPCSSQFPERHSNDYVTSFAVVCPDGLISIEQNFGDQSCSYPTYTMATGCSNGSLKLWRSNRGKTSTPHTPWELVGKFVAHRGPISAIGLSGCGRKVATVCKEFQSNNVSTLQIWDCVHILGAGTFMLEDTLALDGEVSSLNWLALGTGQLLLGVCMQNRLHLYAQRCCGGQTLLNSVKSSTKEIWILIAFANTFSPIRDFLWGPRATAVVVHDSYLSIISQWLFLVNKKHQSEGHPDYIKGNHADCEGEIEKDILSTVFTDSDINDLKELSLDETIRKCKFGTPAQINTKKDCLSRILLAVTQLKYGLGSKLGLWDILQVVDKLSGSLPVYHPEALLMNIYAGNWKRAYLAVRHLVESLTSTCSSKKRSGLLKSSHIVPQIPLSSYFEGLLPKSLPDKEFNWSGDTSLSTSSFQPQRGLSQFAYGSDSDVSNNMPITSTTKSELSAFVEPLENLHELAAITKEKKTEILAIVDLLSEMANPHSASVYESLDESGRRFWVALRYQQLHFLRRFGRPATVEELGINSGLIVWAYHSDCQDNLFAFAFVPPNEPSWQEMRKLGIGFWFTNAAQLRTKMEKLARLQYLKKKDPKDCALLYIALNRIQVLAGLFKISKDEKDKPLVGFLLRNFQEEKNKAAALKNAYVLMGRHQLELAIAFFLLGGDTSSAINVCAKNLGDEQLALVICRLIEGRGGELESHLITKFILPSAIEKGDYWLASLLEWELGNYSQSFMNMLGFQKHSAIETVIFPNQSAFLEPNIGLYCLTLATKNSMRNTVGDQNAAILGRWAILMTATALSRCSLPLEALECLSSSMSTLGNTNQGNAFDIGHHDIRLGILVPSRESCNWLSGDVAFHLECNAKLDLALQYFSKLIREHPSWADTNEKWAGASICSREYDSDQYVELLGSFRHKLYTGLVHYEQKFSLDPICLVSKIVFSLHNQGLLVIGYDILHGYICQDHSQGKSEVIDDTLFYPLMHNPLLRATDETSSLCSRFIAACSITCSQLKHYTKNNESCDSRSSCSDASSNYFRGLMLSLWGLSASLRIICESLSKDLILKPLMIVDLIEYYVYFAYAWLQRNSRGLMLMVQPILVTYNNGLTPYEVDIVDLKKVLPEIEELVSQSFLLGDVGRASQASNGLLENQGKDLTHSIPEDERWKIIGACLWQHMSRFVKHKLNMMSNKLEDSFSSGVSHGRLSPWASSSRNLESDCNSIEKQIGLVTVNLVKVLKTTLAHVSSYHVKHLASYLWQKMDDSCHVMTLAWLEELSQSQTNALYQHLNQDIVNLDMTNGKREVDILWDICADPKIISESFAQEKIIWLRSFDHKPSKRWNEIYKGVRGVDVAEETHNHDNTPSTSSTTTQIGSPSRRLFRNGHTFLSSWQKDTTVKNEVTAFLCPKEIFKRNGELLEALCINSIYQRQAAVASNRKGIMFLNWEDGVPSRDQSRYIWSEADWPLNGWAGSDSTPAPTCVSPGVGLGSKKGAHLGLGGATVGVDSLGSPRRDLTGGGSLGFPGYAGTGASSLGWETQEDFEEFVDPPATVENTSTRAFSSHPSRPFFLVGSSNTHIYLWEFGKDKATATYGVLPAANVPPPYALASISAVQFDQCGHRFATAALDGTVCTWQLEVGGRSNIRPLESSLCFDNHASDVTYVTSSGSIIAVAGYSSNGVNVVIWDTLAPPTTSQASIICHEGGARSLSVFDNDIGSGSVSPLIVTGGTGGDVGLHDFRYIATGKTKRQKHFENGDQTFNTSSNIDTRTGNHKFGEQNHYGMLWYMPKAHSGSVTKVSTIPNSSLFLTGSKDGDVKLWDAKRAKMVCHWPKLHERHTFLQPSTRGFGGVVQAAVTDIQIVSHGFLTCGGDGTVKLIQLKDH
ncbi:hypothetical protein FNV43_RR18120 [Rhamnella rubrinervis]|uniref:RAVE complex protein Rav1 C-terminal domain-containing protein n=1 Tax=Rhamnella rubrinervis TaxID=2594499 RepID=A0A8K0GSK9_9ROSA|nr:hypothetical protein FNV43_RR18120 [Rhamnella rubrinervis]